MNQKIKIDKIIENRYDLTILFSNGTSKTINYSYKTIKDVDEAGMEYHIAYLSDCFITNIVTTIILLGMAILGYCLFDKWGVIIGGILSFIPIHYYLIYDKENKRNDLLKLGMYYKNKRVIDTIATQKQIDLILKDINK